MKQELFIQTKKVNVVLQSKEMEQSLLQLWEVKLGYLLPIIMFIRLSYARFSLTI